MVILANLPVLPFTGIAIPTCNVVLNSFSVYGDLPTNDTPSGIVPSSD
jgi:hypothetical protein